MSFSEIIAGLARNNSRWSHRVCSSAPKIATILRPADSRNKRPRRREAILNSKWKIPPPNIRSQSLKGKEPDYIESAEVFIAFVPDYGT